MSDTATVLFDFDGTQIEDGLTVVEGMTIHVLEDHGEWLWASYDGREGFVPLPYVEIKKQPAFVTSKDTKPSRNSDNIAYATVTSGTFKRDPELDKLLKRKEKIASNEVNYLTIGNSARDGIGEKQTTISSNQLGEKRFEFKRDPQLDTLLRKKEQVFKKGEAPIEPKAESPERRFEFKRDPELDALLKRQQRFEASEVSLDVDENSIRNAQPSVTINSTRRTAEEIKKEVEKVKTSFYYEQDTHEQKTNPEQTQIPAGIKAAFPPLPKSRPSRTPRQSIVPDESESVEEPILFPQALPKSAFVEADSEHSPSVEALNSESVQPKSTLSDQTPLLHQQANLASEAATETEREPSPEVIIKPGTAVGPVTLGRRTVFEMESILESLNVDELLESIEEEESKASEVKTEGQKEESLEDVLGEDLEDVMSSINQTMNSLSTVPIEEIPCVVLFDFDARSSEEVTVRQGEFVTALQDGEEWVKIRTADGREGFVPFTFIQVIGGEGRRVRAIYDYTETGDGRLQLHIGDILTVTEESEGWFEGFNEQGDTGWFPQSYVELL